MATATDRQNCSRSSGTPSTLSASCSEFGAAHSSFAFPPPAANHNRHSFATGLRPSDEYSLARLLAG
eukprot:6922155-Prymnesium_polylepis.1